MAAYTNIYMQVICQLDVDSNDKFYFNFQKDQKWSGRGPTMEQQWATYNGSYFAKGSRLRANLQDDYDDLGQVIYGTVGRDSWVTNIGLSGLPTPCYFKIMTFNHSERVSFSFVDAYDNWGQNPVYLLPYERAIYKNKDIFISGSAFQGTDNTSVSIIVSPNVLTGKETD